MEIRFDAIFKKYFISFQKSILPIHRKQVLIPFVNYLVVLDGDGDRLLAKYYDGRPKSEQIKNEAMLHKKTKAVAAKTERELSIFFL